MPPRIFPPTPQFQSEAERQVLSAIVEELGDNDAIFCNLQLVDPQHGDVEIDFAVFLEDRGLIVIEVKGGHISYGDNSWWQSNSGQARKINPALQARKNMYSLRDFLRNRWSQLNVRTEWIVAFPFTEIVDPGATDLPSHKYMDKADLAFPLSKIKSLLSARQEFSVPQGPHWIEAAIKHLQPISVISEAHEAVLASNHSYIKDLTHERVLLLDQIADNNRFYVRGPAGSGKSWLAFEQAKRWTDAGLKVAVVAFNRGLVTYMEMRNRELKTESQINFIGTFHDFAKHLGAPAGSPSQLDEDDYKFGPGLIVAAENLAPEKKFDAFIIDEAQDFMKSWWETLRLSLKDIEEGKIGAFGDDQQKVYGRRLPPKDFAKFTLNDNIRNSLQIAQVAALLVERSIAIRGPNSFEVDFILCEELEVLNNADDAVSQLTDKEGWQPGEIALLTTKHRHPVHVEQAEHDRLAYWTNLWAGDELFYGTVSGFKGLERPVVILAVDGFHNAEDFNDYLYVGLTRARDKLIIVGNAEIKEKIFGHLKKDG